MTDGGSMGTARPKGHQISWIGYKLHFDVADGGIPLSAILTSASLHDIVQTQHRGKQGVHRPTLCPGRHLAVLASSVPWH